jgi:hypothetical protein
MSLFVTQQRNDFVKVPNVDNPTAMAGVMRKLWCFRVG